MRRATGSSATLAATAVLAAAWAGGTQAGQAARPVQDLAYGEVLFHYFQEDYVTALTRLTAAEARNEIPNHRDEAELLYGALSLSYGQHLLAGEIFERVLAQSVDSSVHDRAWFFLAKVWHQRGYPARAEQALSRIGGALTADLQSEQRMLHAQVLMSQGRFDEALSVLRAWRRPDPAWSGYTQYNIGVALVRLGRTDEGAALLDELGRTAPPRRRNAGMQTGFHALRDRANLALGYAWLQSSQPEQAALPLSRVRLDGPYSSKALLGMGWADAEREDFGAALVAWRALGGRDMLDPAVQESWLAVPYAFLRLGADVDAARHYEHAITAFDQELLRIDETIAAIARGDLVEALLDQQVSSGSGWYFRLDALPDRPESRYLHTLMAGHAFQESLKNYRDLLDVRAGLEHWAESLAVFDDILDARQRAFEQRLPLLEETLHRIDPDAAASRRVALESRLSIAERERDTAALGTRSQQQLLAELEALEPDLARLGNDAEAEELRDRQRVLKGLLLWDLDRDFRARLWQQSRELRDLQLAIRESMERRHRIETFRDEWPDRFEALSGRVNELAPRVRDLITMTDITLSRQARFLQEIAVDELTAQRERLVSYRAEARFALASVYDRASARVDSGATPSVTE